MGNRAKGLVRKFEIKRMDNRDAIGQKHYGCRYCN